MGQHFLLSKAAKTLSLASVARMSDEEARATFAKIRWADNGGNAYCPRCGTVKVYALGTRPQWKCSGCKYVFSVTAGTIFADRKRPVRDYLLAIAIFVNGVKGYAALQLSRDLHCNYRTAFVLAGKIRELLVEEQDKVELSGTVEVDGAYFIRRQRPENKVADRGKKQQSPRKVVVVMRERNGRTATIIVPREGDAVPAIRNRVAPGSIIHADEAAGWNRLYASYDMMRVNHSVEYKSDDGACTNWAESYFARLRRAEFGIHHRISGRYLHQYSQEMAWREDSRRTSNGAQFNMVATLAMRHGVSAKWCGYWNRHEASK